MKQRLSPIISLIFALGIVFQANAQPLDSAIQDLLNEHLPQATLGLVIVDPETNQIVYARRENDNFSPASCTKLYTVGAALKLLGPDFQYRTTLETKHDNILNGTLHDNLYVVFTGDPSFTTSDLKQLFKQLKKNNIHHIKGNIVIDDTAFQDPYYGPGWTLDSTMWAYSAPVSAIILNENKTKVTLDKPTKMYDTLPIHKKSSDAIQVKGQVIGVTREAAKTQCQIKAHYHDNEITLSGCYPYEDTPKILELAIDKPRDYAKNTIHNILRAEHIQLDGKIEFGHAPKQVQPLALKQSAPLKTLIQPILSDSNNLYAESLTKTLGLAYYGKGTFQSGTRAIQTILEKSIPHAMAHCRLEDGSGQSRYNLVSPLSLAQLLQDMTADPTFSDYYKALSVAGVKGTLAPRMQNDLKGQIIAKTGGATGTSCLAGFMKTKSGKVYLFSLMINQFSKPIMQAKNFEDKLCELLAEEPW